jgi:3-methyladenine DNA glycosylase AlkD
MKKALREVLRKTIARSNPHRAMHTKQYMGTQLVCLGLSVPTIRKTQKHAYSFSKSSDATCDRVWDYVFRHSHYFEVKSQALIYFQNKRDHLEKRHWPILKSWASHIDNWEHADRLSDLIAAMHERYPTLVYPQLVKWNKSNNPWQRRLSIVSLFCYSQARIKQPTYAKVMLLLKPLLKDADVYVQKGVGWTLRECYRVYPERTWKFLRSHAARLSAASWQAATERLTRSQKKILKRLRATH